MPTTHNEWADFWRNRIGVNVIPADTRNKRPSVEWKPFQDAPISNEQHNNWKDSYDFDKGMAVLSGKVWHGPGKEGLYLIAIDIDSNIALNELCTRNGRTIPLQKMAEKFIVEQHKDEPNKAHIFFYSPIPFPQKVADNKIGLEVKGECKHGIVFCSPSLHKNGYHYEILGTSIPITLNELQASEFIQHINHICKKYGSIYLEKQGKITEKIGKMLNILRIDNTLTISKGERHVTLISVADSLLIRHLRRSNFSEQELKDFFVRINNELCIPEPLPYKEILSIWNSALNFVKEKRGSYNKRSETSDFDKASIIEDTSEEILKHYRLTTIKETGEILYYNNGVYVPGGDIVIEMEAEKICAYHLSNKYLAEIKGHIKRRTYISKEEFDTDLNIINLKNGLYSWISGELKPHSPDYYSFNQKPIMFDPSAKTKLFGEFLSEVLYPSEIRTVVELIAYSFYRENYFEIITILVGNGSNGKSVFMGLLSSLHGSKNVSNVRLSDMLNDEFALSDLEDKDINIDTELSNTTIRDSAIIKKLTGRQPIRIQRKNQRAYDIISHAKLFFSANKIPYAEDESDAYYRRNYIVSFPNQFEGGKEDKDLLRKLTVQEEMSGIFNVLMASLRAVMKMKSIFISEGTIDERRERYELAIDPIGKFIQEAVAEDSQITDTILKQDLYKAYRAYCKEKELPIESIEQFGKSMKRKDFQNGREASGERRTLWKGLRLKLEYQIKIGQGRLDLVFEQQKTNPTKLISQSSHTIHSGNSI